MRRQSRGSALFLAMVMMIGALALIMGVLTMSTSNVVTHNAYSQREASFLAARGMLRQVFTQITAPAILQALSTNQVALNATHMEQYLSSGTVMPIPSNGAMGPDLPGTWNDVVPPAGVTYVGKKFGTSTITEVKFNWQKADSSITPAFNNWYYISLRVSAQSKVYYDSMGNPLWSQFDPNDPPAIVTETFLLNQDDNYPGFSFVMLSKNTSCSLCHTSFDDVYRYFNADAFAKLNAAGNSTGAGDVATLFGTFQRGKVGSLGNFEVRTLPQASDPNYNQKVPRFFPSASDLEGTFYSRGIVMDNQHQQLSTIPSESLTGVGMGPIGLPGGYFGEMLPINPRLNDSQTGISIQQSTSTSALNFTPLSNSGINSLTGKPNVPQNANLYLQYPTNVSDQTDGLMPSNFPFPFADPKTGISDPTRMVTPTDLQALITDRKNNVGDPLNPNKLGTLSGGYATVIPPAANAYPAAYGNRLPDPSINSTYPAANQLADSATVTGGDYVNGNLILVGTKANPVNLSDQVFVKGDIVIKGYYTGKGTMWASGNVYIPSDVQYLDDQLLDPVTKAPLVDKNGKPLENFGVKNNATGAQNLGGFIAGGTIIIGDYLTSSLSASPTSSDVTTNQPPDWNNTPTADPVAPSLASPLPLGREQGFPLVPTYQTGNIVDPSLPQQTYPYFQLNPTTGKYVLQDGSSAAVPKAPLYAKNFALSQLEIFNRDEWGKTQQMLPDKLTGSYTVPNSTYDSTYMPRYYVMNPGDPVSAYLYGSQALSTNATQLSLDAFKRSDSANQGIGTYWDNGSATVPAMWKGFEMSKIADTTVIGGDSAQGAAGSYVNGQQTQQIYDPTKTMLVNSTSPATQTAAVVPLNPAWVKTDTMWKMLLNEEWDRKAHNSTSQAVYGSDSRDGSPFRIDGLLYTNNAIFGIQRNRALAPQANGDYKDAVESDGVTPYKPDPTSPGPFITEKPVQNTAADVYTGTQVVDRWQANMMTDTYNFTQAVDNYTMPQWQDTYKVTAYTWTWSYPTTTDTWQLTQNTDHWYYQQTTFTYTASQTFDLWKQPDTTVNTTVYNWNITYNGTYGPTAATMQTTTPTPPTVYGTAPAVPVLSAAPANPATNVTSTTVPGAQAYVLGGSPAPAGYTIQLASYTQSYTGTTVLDGTTPGAPPANPASGSNGGVALPPLPANFFTNPTSQSTVSIPGSVGPYTGSSTNNPPDNLHSWSPSNPFTTSSITQSANITYQTGFPPATPIAGYAPPISTANGWAKTNTTTGTSSTSLSQNGNPTPPAPPAGYTQPGVTVTPTSVQNTYTTAPYPTSAQAGPIYNPGPFDPGTVVQNSIAPLTAQQAYVVGTTPPPAPADFAGPTPWVKGATTTSPGVPSTSTGTVLTYAQGTTAPAGPSPAAAYSKVTTGPVVTFSLSPPYLLTQSPDGSLEPVPPAPYTLASANFASPPYPQTVTTSVPRTNNGTLPGPRPAGYYNPVPSGITYNYPNDQFGNPTTYDMRKFAKEQVSSSRGRLMINGAAIAPDVGLLVTGRPDPTGKYRSNLILNYDKRIPNLIKLPSPDVHKWMVQYIGWSQLQPGKAENSSATITQ